MRLIFMGTPAFGIPALDALESAGHEIKAVYAQPPRPAGRGQKLTPAATALWAAERGIPVKTPVTLKNPEIQAEFSAFDADIAIVAAYGLILPKAILDAPRFGCLNIHASLLPRWRGAAPIQRAILAGDAESGVAIMQMDAGLDTGAVRLSGALSLDGLNGGAVHDALAALGGQLLLKVLDNLDAYPPVPQPDAGITYAAKIDKRELRLDWTQPADVLLRQIRAFAPAPCAYFEHNGTRFKVLDAELVKGKTGVPGVLNTAELLVPCGVDSLRLTELQRAGKNPQSADELLRGYTGFVPGAAL
ncbi:MAG: methionyl-tRNA formyltransferase [Thalassospira sp.]|nr:methionyl-tRNA formyltransferase [Thalassospira sp.]